MASRASGRQGEVSDKDTLFAVRFFYDVLVYTLKKCGILESSLPTTDLAENIYHDADFVKMAGASVLRISLVMRDEWIQMFKSQRNSGGLTTKESVVDLLIQLETYYDSSRTNRTLSFIEVLLASCNEILMYFHVEKINIDFDRVILLVSVYIQSMIGVYENESVKLEELFDNFDDISGYTEWITDFITKFAIPYGCDNVSIPFIERLRKQYNDDPRKQRDSLRFLPCNVFLAITNEGSETPSDSESPEPPKLPTDSEIGAVGGKKSSVCRSTCTENVFEQFDQSKLSSQGSSEEGIEQSSRGSSEEGIEQSSRGSSEEGIEQSSRGSSEEGIEQRGQGYSEEEIERSSRGSSEVGIEQRGQGSSEVGIEQDIGELSLDANEDSQEIHVKDKTAQNETDIGKKKES